MESLIKLSRASVKADDAAPKSEGKVLDATPSEMLAEFKSRLAGSGFFTRSPGEFELHRPPRHCALAPMPRQPEQTACGPKSAGARG
jgi:hypothetical protein